MKKCSAILLLFLLVSAAAEGQSVYTVDRQQVNVRQDATTQSTRVGILRQGEQVSELRRVGLWMEVLMPDGAPGWIHAQLLRSRLIVDGEGLRLRDKPAASGTSVTMLFRGQEVSELSQRGNWTQVELQDGRTGWLSKQYVRAKTTDDLRQERPAKPVPPVAVEIVASERLTAVAVQRDPYAEGLQHEASGDHALALDSFTEVLTAEPDHVNALVHAAQAHRKMGEYNPALGKLYHGLRLTGGRKDVYLTLGEIYRVQSAPDSAAKYQALFRGDPIPQPGSVSVDPAQEPKAVGGRDEELGITDLSPLPKGNVLDDLPKKAPVEDDGGLSFDTPWLPVGLAGVGLLALAAVGWWVVSTSSHRTRKGAAVVSDPRFEKVWSEESKQARHGKATTAEEAELDRQIDTHWKELKESATAFAPAPMTGEGVDGILDQVEGLRQTLEGQDERARIYADIVRLQNMKIEAMAEEVMRLRKAKPKG